MRWMTPVSLGDLSPMERLVSWLERNGEEYRSSKRKIHLLEELEEEMITNGVYGLTISSIRSQILRLKHGVQQKAEGGKCPSKDINQFYDRLLFLLFDEDERAKMRERAEERASDSKSESRRARKRVKAPRKVVKTEDLEETEDETGDVDEPKELPVAKLQRAAPIDPILDTAEIRRRFELVSARQELRKQGVDPETIDSMLPLRLE